MHNLTPKAPSLITCPKCGTEMHNYFEHCHDCGANLWKKLKCGHSFPITAPPVKHCGCCGKPTGMKLPYVQPAA